MYRELKLGGRIVAAMKLFQIEFINFNDKIDLKHTWVTQLLTLKKEEILYKLEYGIDSHKYWIDDSMEWFASLFLKIRKN